MLKLTETDGRMDRQIVWPTLTWNENSSPVNVYFFGPENKESFRTDNWGQKYKSNLNEQVFTNLLTQIVQITINSGWKKHLGSILHLSDLKIFAFPRQAFADCSVPAGLQSGCHFWDPSWRWLSSSSSQNCDLLKIIISIDLINSGPVWSDPENNQIFSLLSPSEDNFMKNKIVNCGSERSLTRNIRVRKCQ